MRMDELEHEQNMMASINVEMEIFNLDIRVKYR
jgi:hypothetical protein